MPVAAPSSCRYCIGCHGCRYCIGPDDCDEFCGCGPETDDETDDETDVWSGDEFFNDTPLHPDVVLQLGEVATDETPVKQVSVSSDVNGFLRTGAASSTTSSLSGPGLSLSAPGGLPTRRGALAS